MRTRYAREIRAGINEARLHASAYCPVMIPSFREGSLSMRAYDRTHKRYYRFEDRSFPNLPPVPGIRFIPHRSRCTRNPHECCC